MSSRISLCVLHSLIWCNTLRTCIKPHFTRMQKGPNMKTSILYCAGISLLVASQTVALGDEVLYRVRAEPEYSGIVTTYRWNFKEPRPTRGVRPFFPTTLEPEARYSFQTFGRYNCLIEFKTRLINILSIWFLFSFSIKCLCFSGRWACF